MGPFATVTELVERVGHAAPPDDLGRWQAALRDASNLIRMAKGQVLSFVPNESVILLPSVTEVLYLPETPVTAMASVTENSVLLTVNTHYTFTDVGVLTRWSDATHRTSRAWTYGATVVYSHGFVETSTGFGDLRALTLDIVQRSLFGPQGEVFGPERVEARGWAADIHLMDADHTRILNLGAVPVG